jgi:hypothetical protein
MALPLWRASRRTAVGLLLLVGLVLVLVAWVDESVVTAGQVYETMAASLRRQARFLPPSDQAELRYVPLRRYAMNVSIDQRSVLMCGRNLSSAVLCNHPNKAFGGAWLAHKDLFVNTVFQQEEVSLPRPTVSSD